MLKHCVIVSVICILLSSCGGGKRVDVSDTLAELEYSSLPEVVVPDSIIDPQQRADYVLAHYWDALNLGDRELMHDSAFLTSKFSDFAQQYSYASPQGAMIATERLLKRLENYVEIYHRFVELANAHIIERKSKDYSEIGAVAWIAVLSESPLLTESQKQDYGFKLKKKRRNSPGFQAADFTFNTREGKHTSLYSQRQTQYTLLAFVSPDCETCDELIRRVRNDKRITKFVDRGQVSVVLIDVGGEEEAFKRSVNNLPSKWTVGYDTSGIVSGEIYAVEHTPTLYLLDRYKKVILRDATVDELIDYARSH